MRKHNCVSQFLNFANSNLKSAKSPIVQRTAYPRIYTAIKALHDSTKLF